MKKNKRLPPYQLNGDGNPIDLNNPDDRDLVIKRNKFLQESIEDGIQIHRADVKPIINIGFPCFKCGSEVQITQRPDLENGYYVIELGQIFNSVKCKCCGSKFRIDEHDNIFLTQSKTTKK